MTHPIQDLAIDKIRRDSGAQYRVDGVSAIHAMRLKEALESGETLPPIIVFYDGSTYWMGDGDHRIEAHFLHGLDTISAEVRPGTQQDAKQYGRGTNAEHGLPRKNKDKKAAVLAALQDPDWQGWSQGAIARACKVSSPFVKTVAEESGLTINIYSEERTFTTKHGTVATMNTGNLGRPAAAPTAAPEATAPPISEPSTPDPATAPPISALDASAPATPPPADTRDLGAYPVDYFDEAAFAGVGYVPEYESDPVPDEQPVPDTSNTPQTAAPTSPATGATPATNAPAGHAGSMKEVAAELEAQKRRELEAMIEALPLAQALSLYAHRGHLFKEQARLWYENEKVRAMARWAASQVRMTTGPFSEAVRELARVSKAEPNTWEGCSMCKGSTRVGERNDPCPRCVGGFTVYKGEGVSAESVAARAEEDHK